MKHLAALGLLVAGLTACGPIPRSVTVLGATGGAWPQVLTALQSGPMPVTVVGAAYPGASPDESQALIAQAVTSGITWYPARVVDGRKFDSLPSNHMVWVMDASSGTDPTPLCAGPVTPKEAGKADPDRIHMLAVFCSGGTVDTAVQGSVDRSPEDPTAAPDRLARQMVRQLADRGMIERDNDEVEWLADGQ
ncbi:MAG: hypothetical protein K9H25_14185 [Rhodospirillum sp.]|nr:hypothetical protein [Rhodospirillum sp.]MCF8491136.1 hypothetical protein [Rhodospirillum sp.]MCF8503036.1 hypothetical protein [Rhodospirillum sp.]